MAADAGKQVAQRVAFDALDRIVVTGPDGERVEELGTRSSYTYQLEALAAHLRSGRPLVTGAEDAVANMELIDEVYRAAGLAPRPRLTE